MTWLKFITINQELKNTEKRRFRKIITKTSNSFYHSIISLQSYKQFQTTHTAHCVLETTVQREENRSARSITSLYSVIFYEGLTRTKTSDEKIVHINNHYRHEQVYKILWITSKNIDVFWEWSIKHNDARFLSADERKTGVEAGNLQFLFPKKWSLS